MNWSKIHERREIGPSSFPLAFFSLLYGVGAELRIRAYERRRKARLPGFTMSIGNITAGGTGKTPAAVMLAMWAADRGYRTAVLSRGYRGRYREQVLEVSDGRVIKAAALEAGDEPILMAKRLPGVPIILSRKRYLAGLYAAEKFDSNFFVLDDGFQHYELQRDLDLVLLDAGSPFGNGRLLPWGPLREPKGNLERATAFLITRWSGADIEKRWLDFITRRFPGKPIFKTAHVAERVVLADECHGPDFLKGKRVLAFAGIAKPSAFRTTLIESGAEVADLRFFRDHQPFTEAQVRDLETARVASGSDLLITTEKDFVRLERFRTICPRLAYLTVSMRILSGEERFFGLVQASCAETEALRS